MSPSLVIMKYWFIIVFGAHLDSLISGIDLMEDHESNLMQLSMEH